MNKIYKNKYLKYKSKYRVLLMNLNGGMNKEEFFKKITNPTDEDFNSADEDNDNKISDNEFSKWLESNEGRKKDDISEDTSSKSNPVESESTEEQKIDPSECMKTAIDVTKKIKEDKDFAKKLEELLSQEI